MERGERREGGREASGSHFSPWRAGAPSASVRERERANEEGEERIIPRISIDYAYSTSREEEKERIIGPVWRGASAKLGRGCVTLHSNIAQPAIHARAQC